MEFAKCFDQHRALSPRGDNIFELFSNSVYDDEEYWNTVPAISVYLLFEIFQPLYFGAPWKIVLKIQKP